jgi:hypothetical protein
VDLDAEVCGPDGGIPARTVNVSASGVLLRIHEDALRAWGESIAEEVEKIFGESFRVRFPGASMDTRAKLVRVTRPTPDSTEVLLGCQFSLNLHQGQLKRLGVEPGECGCRDRLGPRPSSILPLATDGRSRVVVCEHRSEEPVCDGRLVGLGGFVVAAQVGTDESEHLLSRLDGRDLDVHVEHEDENLWSVGARMLALRLTEEPEEALEVALLAESPPSPDVTARFRVRA